jgi:putative FmdB family regulatory protein
MTRRRRRLPKDGRGLIFCHGSPFALLFPSLPAFPDMPIYAFECTQCGHSFDRLQKLSDPDPDTCPECSMISVKRQVTAPSFRLAGSGWYETDFKKDGDKKRNLADSGDGASKPAGDSKPAVAAPAAKVEAKSEAKPAAAPSTPAA